MTSYSFARLSIVTVVAALSLVACSSDADDASSETVDRQASGLVRGAELCISREASAGPMTVTFRNSIKSVGNGPFNLDYIQCGENSTDESGPVLELDIADATGTDVLYMSAYNVALGYPGVRVALNPGLNPSVLRLFKDGESFTYNVGEYEVRVERQPDTATAKSFRAWVSRP